MTIQELIAELDAKREKAGKDHNDILSSGYIAYATALMDAYPKLRAAALAGERLAEAVEEVDSYEGGAVCEKKCFAALRAYREATQ